MVTDVIGDFLNRIKNAQNAGHPTVLIPCSKEKISILEVLISEGYVAGKEVIKDDNDKPVIKVLLKYDGVGLPAIRAIKRLSRPGKRHYVKSDAIPLFKNGLGLVILSTSQGMVPDREARTKGVGGELICSVF